jgi:anti-sigma regulatory factor (Ser/Thr protein kinase)
MGNLLLPVRVSIETLERAGLPAPLRDDVQRIRTSAEYLQRLATGLRLMALDPEKLRDGGSVDLAAWWREASLVCKNALPRGVVLEADIPAGLRAAMSKAALTQAVFNLCQNAGEALAGCEGGLVRVEGRAAPGDVTLSVRDNGPGMAEEVRRRCLEPFFTTKSRGISTGLGLSLVNGLVCDAGGSVEIESSPGAGTTFRLRLRPAPPPVHGPFNAVGRAVVRMADARTRAFVAAELVAQAMEVVDGDPVAPVDLCVKDPSADSPPARRTVVLGRAGGAREAVVGRDVSTDAIRRAIREAAASLRPHGRS